MASFYIHTSTVLSSTKQNPLDVLVALSLMRRISCTGMSVIPCIAVRTCKRISCTCSV